MPRESTLIELDDDATERVLAPGRVRRFYLLFLPLLLSFVSCGGGGWLMREGDVLLLVGIALIGVGVMLGIGYVVFETFFIGVLPARCYLRWLRERIDQRPDAVVTADDPDAFFVQHIPRKNWQVSFGENAVDVGLLKLDHRNRLLKYEGDVERWVVPAERIHSFELRSFTPSNGVEFLNRHTVVMLRFEGEDDNIVVRPLAAHPLSWSPWTPGAREFGARCLRQAIRHFLDPEEYQPPYEEDLDALIPPPR